MPSILKRFMRPKATEYVFPEMGESNNEEPEALPDVSLPEAEMPAQEPPETMEAEPEQKQPVTPMDFAEIEAAKMMEEAKLEAEDYKKKARQELEAELEELRRSAREEGYREGFDQGISEARKESRAELQRQSEEQAKTVKQFLEDAAKEKAELIESSKEELKDLSLAIAEKVIRISLKSSSDILLRMIESATDKHKRCEWAHIYIADCDTKAMALTIPELTSALRHVSDRVRIIPMADDESGTCIIELPDEIIDASVSTQLDAIRGVMSSSGPDKGGA